MQIIRYCPHRLPMPTSVIAGAVPWPIQIAWDGWRASSIVHGGRFRGFGMNNIRLRYMATLLFAIIALPTLCYADRVKDLATIAGVRTNQLIGYGLVVGLDGTGDQTSQTPFTVQSLESMLEQLGVTMPANSNPQLKNVAAVMVSAQLPPFSKPGQLIDVTVSSIGKAKSLGGGALLMAPMKGANG